MQTNTHFSIFNKFPKLLVAVSLRENGSMKIRADLERDEEALANRAKFYNKIGLSGEKIVNAKLVHGDNIEIVSSKDGGQFIPQVDGLITDQKDVYLCITVADCMPVVIYDPQNEVVSLAHCGWGGLDKKIIEKIIKKMQEGFGAKAEELVVGIGPGISNCHFEVKEDVLSKFKEYPEALIKRDSKDFIDLKLVAKRQLEELGIISRNIEVSPDCTYCLEEKYFSFRRDKPAVLQTMLFVVGMN